MARPPGGQLLIGRAEGALGSLGRPLESAAGRVGLLGGALLLLLGATRMQHHDNCCSGGAGGQCVALGGASAKVGPASFRS